MGLAWNKAGRVDGPEDGPEPVAYDDEEEAMVAERLRALGYLE